MRFDTRVTTRPTKTGIVRIEQRDDEPRREQRDDEPARLACVMPIERTKPVRWRTGRQGRRLEPVLKETKNTHDFLIRSG